MAYKLVCPKCGFTVHPHKGTPKDCPRDGTLLEKRCTHCGHKWPEECICN